MYKGKGKDHPRTGHESPEGDQMYSSTLPSTSAPYGGGWLCASGLVWTGAENIVPTGIRSPDRPARSESLYQPRYPGPWSGGISPLILNLEMCGGSGQRHVPMTLPPRKGSRYTLNNGLGGP